MPDSPETLPPPPHLLIPGVLLPDSTHADGPPESYRPPGPTVDPRTRLSDAVIPYGKLVRLAKLAGLADPMERQVMSGPPRFTLTQTRNTSTGSKPPRPDRPAAIRARNKLGSN